MSAIELTTAARTYREIQAEIKALQEQADALKATITAEMDAQKAETLQAGEYTIRYSIYESKRVDTAKLKAAGLYEQYSATGTALRFQIA